MASSTKSRPSSQLPKAPTSLSSSCVIADTAVLAGGHLITISANAVLHPRARINSTYGPVTIGEGCIISEKASVGLLDAPAEGSSVNDDAALEGVVLEKDVVLEPAAVVEGSRVGEGTTLEAGSKVCAAAVLGKYCKVAPLCTVPPEETLEDFTIVYGNNQHRRENPGLEHHRKLTHDKEIEVLRKLIPSNLAKWRSEVG